ncbi:MAG: 50S ribosomal protein L13 [Clostridia bacterium]|nr:50S ribosomal protein L13 [Clostridia bacterium]
MSTFMANKATIERKWYVIDAAGVPLGHTAAKAAVLLRGKNKTDFTPNADCGDFVVIVNADKAVLTGKKPEQKMYRTHSGYVGGLKEVKYRILMAEKPELAMTLAVKGMMPKNTISRWALKRLKVYAGPTHKHSAQKPELLAND